MQSKATTVEQYLAELPPERRAALEVVRAVILQSLDGRGFVEGMQYGMIGYFVPHSVFPAGYHTDPKQPLLFVALASQKNYMSLYLLGTYVDPEREAWLREAWAKTGKKLDMGKTCVRFNNVEELALGVVGESIRRVSVEDYVAGYEASLAGAGKGVKSGGKKVAKAAGVKVVKGAGVKRGGKKVAKVMETKKVSKTVTEAKKASVKAAVRRDSRA